MNEFEILAALPAQPYEDETGIEQERGRTGGARTRAPVRRAAAPRAPARRTPPRARPPLQPKPRVRPRPRPLPLPPSWPPYGASYVWPAVIERSDGTTPAPLGGTSGGSASPDDERWRCVQACFNRQAGLAPQGAAAPDAPTPEPDAAAPDGDAAAQAAGGEPGEFETGGRYDDEYEDEYESGVAPDCKIIDLTAQAERSHRKATRDPKSVYALVLHQMACCFRRRDPLRSYLGIKAHFAILPEGQILQLHPVSALLWASHGFNSKSVAVEFAGNFPNVKGGWWKGETYGRNRPTAAQLEAGRCLIRHLVRTMGLRVVLAHRQSSNMRENDPGPEVWYHVGQWAVDTLGLSDGGPGFKIGSGKPILDAWRTWGRAASSPELGGEYEGEYEGEFEGEGEGEFETPSAGLMTLPAAIADPRAASPGVYTLFKDGQRVYVGRATELRQRLQQHLLCLTHLKLGTGRFRVKLTPLAGASPVHLGRVESAVIGRFGRAAQGGPLANVKSREF